MIKISNRIDKPKKTAKELVEKMRDEKGITFKYTSEEKAIKYLSNSNNYLRTASYRKNYNKAEAGPNKGKYLNLDFAYLQELSVIDMHLRFIISKMCFDIEHALKVKLLLDIEEDGNIDGYDIVESFLKENNRVVSRIEEMADSPFTADLITKYFTIEKYTENGREKSRITEYDDCPAWILVEVLPYGEFIRFYKHYYGSNTPIKTNLLHLVRSLRNGTAHNNCIIANLNHNTSIPPAEIKEAVKRIKGITPSTRQKKLSTRPLLEFTTLVYVYSKIVDDKVRKHRAEELKNLFSGRLIEKKDFYLTNERIVTSYQFAKAIVDNIL